MEDEERQCCGVQQCIPVNLTYLNLFIENWAQGAPESCFLNKFGDKSSVIRANTLEPKFIQLFQKGIDKHN